MSPTIHQNYFSKLASLLLMTLTIAACAQAPDDKALGLATLSLKANSEAIILDDTIQYTATFTDARGDELNNVSIDWNISDDTIATITDDGLVTGLSIGQVKISATVTTDDAGMTNSNEIMLTVTDDPNAISSVKITNTKNSFFVDTSEQFSAEAFNINNEMLEASSVIWSSSDETVALIDSENGNTTFLSSGTARLSITIDGIRSNDFIVNVHVKSQSRTANFQKAAHAISGMATLQVNDAGNLEVIFSTDFSVDNGPGLEVFLSKEQTPSSSSINLGSLIKITGGQSYAVPNGVMIDDFDWIIVHCVPYNIVFGRGSLQ